MKAPWLLLCVALLVGVQADFAAQMGFSGRIADCTSCHRPPLVDDDAAAILEGLPAAWEVDQTYDLRVAVEGGPAAIPGQPQGGFELEVGAGVLRAGEGFADELRHPRPTITTYEPAGTLMRAWNLEWQSPNLAKEPGPVGVWLAVVSANGNHVVATNMSDLGEHGDASAKAHFVVPPSQAAVDAWQALPLAPPRIDSPHHLVAKPGASVLLEGEHADGNATGVGIQVDGGLWTSRVTGDAWRIELPFVDGEHTVSIRSEGAGRTSAAWNLTLEGRGDASSTPQTPREATPLPIAVVIIGLALAIRR